MVLACTLNLTLAAEHQVRAVRIDDPPVIDGRIDESVWQLVEPVQDFIQLEPRPGEPATHETLARVLYDDEYLYVGIVALKSDMEALAINATRRDSHMFSDDSLQVELDTYHDRRNSYLFVLNPLGTQVDGRVANEGTNMGRGGSATAWDCDWQGQAWRGDDRWSAEFAIPFSELRFPKKPGATWGINFRRNDESLNEESSWSDLGNNDWAISRFGTLVGLDTLNLDTRRPFEFKPYGTMKPQSQDGLETIETEWDTGVDFRYPFSKFTFDFTLNPDFAQIEADPEEVNLSDIELRLTEKRPFFQEGAELFSMPAELFYSRRIEDLLWGGKVVGKAGPTSFALVDAQARPQNPDDEGNQPESNYTVARAIRDVGSRSAVGLLMVNKQSSNRYDRALSTDLRLELPADIRISGQAALNWNSEHPQSEALGFNIKRDTNTWDARLSLFDTGRDFDAEAGFIPRTDRWGYRGSLGYRVPTRGKRWRRLSARANVEQLWDHEGELMNEHVGAECSVGYRNMFFFFGPERYFHVTGEGDRFTDLTWGSFIGWFPPKWASIRSRISFGTRDDKSSFFVGPEVSLRPTERLNLEFRLQRLVEDDELIHLTRRFSVSYQFTQRMYLKGNAEFTKEGDRRLFLVYGYEFQPESNAFIVYSDNRERDEETDAMAHEQILFLKVSYLVKLKWF